VLHPVQQDLGQPVPAVAAQEGVPVNAVDVSLVQDELRRQGTVLE